MKSIDQSINVNNLGQRYPDSLNGEVTARKMSEALQTTLGSVLQTIDYSLGEFLTMFKKKISD